MKLEERILKVVVLPEGELIYAESALYVTIEDEGAGEFIVLNQDDHEGHEQRIVIDVEEWPAYRAAIDKMIKGCRNTTKS